MKTQNDTAAPGLLLKKISVRATAAFLVTFSLCVTLVFALVSNRSEVERLAMNQLIMEKSAKINDVITKLLYKTHTLAFFITQNDGEIVGFEQMAASVVDDPSIKNVILAPDGKVSAVYPLEGNEEVIGLDFFTDAVGNKDAISAVETESLVLGGPFESVQGGQVLVGRLPVFLEKANGRKEFWGLVSVTLKYPQALDGAGLAELQIQGFTYEIWRINPDDNSRQIIADSGHTYGQDVNYVERSIVISNTEWQFRILPVKSWYEFSETWISVFASIAVSVLVASVVQKNSNLRVLKEYLEGLSNTDALTNIHNRRYFMEVAAKQTDRIARTGGAAFIIMYDLDHFKQVNDTYSHQAGDAVLKETSTRVSKTLRSYDLFARYGGEEFIVLALETDKDGALRLAERICADISGKPIQTESALIPVTASFGVAAAAPENNLETAIAMADLALYKAKSSGRNQICFYDGKDAVRV